METIEHESWHVVLLYVNFEIKKYLNVTVSIIEFMQWNIYQEKLKEFFFPKWLKENVKCGRKFYHCFLFHIILFVALFSDTFIYLFTILCWYSWIIQGLLHAINNMFFFIFQTQ